jgi:hypothetical protein
LIPKDECIAPFQDAKESEKSIRSQLHQGLFKQFKMSQCFSLKAISLRDGPTFCSINGLLLILMETNQGVTQNPLVPINMVLSAQTFGLNGWMTKPTWLHMHVMVFCQVLNKEPCMQVCGRTTNHLAYPTLPMESLNLDLQGSQHQ